MCNYYFMYTVGFWSKQSNWNYMCLIRWLLMGFDHLECNCKNYYENTTCAGIRYLRVYLDNFQPQFNEHVDLHRTFHWNNAGHSLTFTGPLPDIPGICHLCDQSTDIYTCVPHIPHMYTCIVSIRFMYYWTWLQMLCWHILWVFWLFAMLWTHLCIKY